MRFYKKRFFFLMILLASFQAIAQGVPQKKASLNEENFLKFQESFFNALAQKSIANYRAAIQSLENCNELKPNDISVLFELSKNYLELNSFFEAEQYAKQALAITPDNYWILVHLSEVYSASKSFANAIDIHKQIVKINPKEKEKLALLYYQNKQRDKSKQLILELEKTGSLNYKLRNLKQKFKSVTPNKQVVKVSDIKGLIKEFDTNKSFETLNKILTLSVDRDLEILLSYSQLGLELYPAQASVYLMNAKGLYQTNNYEKAIEQLNNGIDFVIDDALLEAEFYDEIAKSYDRLGKTKEALKNKNKAASLRKKRKE